MGNIESLVKASDVRGLCLHCQAVIERHAGGRWVHVKSTPCTNPEPMGQALLKQLANDIDTIAHAEIVAAVEYDIGAGNISHESCPEIGAHDWDLIAERIKEIIEGLTPDSVKRADAYARLIERAD